MRRKGITATQEQLAFVIVILIIVFFLLVWTGIAGDIAKWVNENLPLKVKICKSLLQSC